MVEDARFQCRRSKDECRLRKFADAFCKVSEELVLTDNTGLHLGAGPYMLIYSRATEENDSKTEWSAAFMVGRKTYSSLLMLTSLQDTMELENEEFICSVEAAAPEKGARLRTAYTKGTPLRARNGRVCTSGPAAWACDCRTIWNAMTSEGDTIVWIVDWFRQKSPSSFSISSRPSWVVKHDNKSFVSSVPRTSTRAQAISRADRSSAPGSLSSFEIICLSGAYRIWNRLRKRELKVGWMVLGRAHRYHSPVVSDLLVGASSNARAIKV